MPLTTQGLRLTSGEIAYLAALAGAPALVGIPDPFAGAMPEEIAQQLDAARASLLEGGVITGSLEIAPAWADILAPVFGPEAVAVVHRWTAAHGSATTALYFASGRATAQTLDGGEYCLEATFDLDRLLELPPERPATAPPGTLPLAALRKASSLARQSGLDAALAVLVEQGLAPETAALLAETLASPQRSWLVRLLRSAGAGWESQTCSLTWGPGGLFEVREGAGGAITVLPEPQSTVREMIAGFIAKQA